MPDSNNLPHPHLTYSETERDKGGKEGGMHRAFWTTMQIAIAVFAFSVFIAPSNHAPILVGGVPIEPIILLVALLISPVFYVFACLKDLNFHLDWAVTYVGFFLFVYVLFPFLFVIWLNVSFNPRPGYGWRQTADGIYSYLPVQEMAEADKVHTKHAMVSPPAIDPP